MDQVLGQSLADLFLEDGEALQNVDQDAHQATKQHVVVVRADFFDRALDDIFGKLIDQEHDLGLQDFEVFLLENDQDLTQLQVKVA